MTVSSPGDQRDPPIKADRRRPVAVWLTIGVVAAPIAVWAFNQGLTDWHYELAGRAEWWLGQPAPERSIAIGLVATAAIAVVASVVRKLAGLARRRRGSGGDAPAASWTRPRWWLPLATGWIAYALGSAAGVAGGGPRTYEATMRFSFGAPIGAAVEVPATCTTPVGKPELAAEVVPDAEGLFRLTLLNVATGARSPYPQPTGVSARLVGTGEQPGFSAATYPLPNVPARPLPYLQTTSGDGSTQSMPPIGILEVYDYRVVRVDDRGMTGTVNILGTRFGDPYGGGSPTGLGWINLVIANDPWPQTLDVTVSWSCANGAGSAQR